VSSERDDNHLDDPYDDEPLPRVYSLGPGPPSELELRLDARDRERAARRAARLAREQALEQERQALEDEERRRRQAIEDEKGRLEIELLRRQLGQSRLSKREPIPVPQLTTAVWLLIAERASIRAAATAADLSKQKISYVKVAIKHGDVSLDPAGCLAFGPDTQNTPEGVRLPKR
jgi:hypothetical protein